MFRSSWSLIMFPLVFAWEYRTVVCVDIWTLLKNVQHQKHIFLVGLFCLLAEYVESLASYFSSPKTSFLSRLLFFVGSFCGGQYSFENCPHKFWSSSSNSCICVFYKVQRHLVCFFNYLTSLRRKMLLLSDRTMKSTCSHLFYFVFIFCIRGKKE